MNFYRLAVWAPDASFNFLCGGTADEVCDHVKNCKELCARIGGAPIVVNSFIKANKERRDRFLNGDNIVFLVEEVTND